MRERRPAPVDTAIRRGAAAEIASLPPILRDPRGRPRFYQGQDLVEQNGGLPAKFSVEAPGRVGKGDGHCLLGDNIAGIGLVHHAMQGDARLRFAIDQHPVDGAAAAIIRQEGTVEIEGPPR